MDKYKKIIKISCISLIVIISIILIVIFLIKKSPQYNIDEYDDTQGELGINKFDSSVQNVKIRNNFYAVKLCMNKFYNYYFETTGKLNNKYIVDEEQSNSNNKVLYDMLDNKYISFKNITEENILNRLPKINYSDIQIRKMYVSQRTPNVAVYFVYGYFNDRINNEQIDFYNIVKMDMLNKTFKIIPQDFSEREYENIKIGDSLQFDEFSSIENKNNNNIFEYEIISDEQYIKDIFDQYKQNLIYNKPLAYEQLNMEYKEKRFPTYETFEKYLEQNGKRIVSMEIEKYQKTVYKEYTQYVCLDNLGKYYIFYINDVINYETILDMHSVNIQQFIDEYKKSNEKQKVLMNLEKILDALNEKDYMYIYNKLDENFKKNKFNNLELFIEYVNDNFYENNDFEYNRISEEKDVYMVDVVIKDKNNDSSIKSFTMIMKLLDKDDFVISFSSN